MQLTSRRVLLVLNLMLAASLLAFTPKSGQAEQEQGLRDCCAESTEGFNFCCDNCCWLLSDCKEWVDCYSG